MIRRIDTTITAAHQWVVDLTQRQPAWLGRQCAAGMGLIVVVRVALGQYSALWVAALALCAVALLWALTFSAWLYDKPTGFIRVFSIANLAAGAVALSLAPSALPTFVYDLLLLAYNYFGTCRPPRPRAPRARGRFAVRGAA